MEQVIIPKNYNNRIDFKSMALDRKQIAFLSITGSRMYGTATPMSDKDYIGIYIPTREQMVLGNFPKQASLKENDLDVQIWSIQYFLQLACKGETLAMDLLHSPYNCWVIHTQIWGVLHCYKNLFYTKKMKAFISYARKQAAKYGVKGDRIIALKKVIEFLKGYCDFQDIKLSDVWNRLPTGEHIHFVENETPIRMYQVCGKKFQETVKITYVLENLQKSLTEYGKRAIMAEKNQGVDWKAISHAIRAAEQIFWILRYGEYKYPLKNAHFIRSVKLGKIDFKMAIAVLEDYMEEIEKMMEKSNLPEEVDKELWDKWLIDCLTF